MSSGSNTDGGETSSPYSLLHIASSFGEEAKIKEILTQYLMQMQKNPLQKQSPPSENLSKSGSSNKTLTNEKRQQNDTIHNDFFGSSSSPSFLVLDDRNLLDHRGNNPLFWACHFGQNDAVSLLIKQFRMPINRQNFDGETPLLVSVMSGSFDVVCTLLDAGANPNIANGRAETPLHIAACFGYADICREIIKFGGWIDAEDDCGDTPLHWAVREEQIEIVRILLSSGADPYHLNEDDESPLNLAETVGTDSLVNVFDSIACSMDSEIDGEAYGFTFMNSTDFSNVSKGPDRSTESISMDVDSNDDSLSGGTVDIDINSSGTVYPSSLGKEDEYLYVAGKPVNNNQIIAL